MTKIYLLYPIFLLSSWISAAKPNMPPPYPLGHVDTVYGVGGNIGSTAYATGAGTEVSQVESCQHDLSTFKYEIEKSFDLDGNLVAEVLRLKDCYGRLDFLQKKDLSSGNVLAQKSLYDRYGRLAITTLPAALSTTDFCYDQTFINADQGAYDYLSFDLTPTLANVQGEAYNPLPVSNTSTLGQYYSEGSSHPSVGSTNYPFTRRFYSDNSYDKLIGTSGYDLQFLSSDQKFTRTYEVSPSDEFRYVYGVEASHLLSDGQGVDFGDLRIRKRVIITPNEDVVVEYISDDDKTVARCLSGTASTDCINQVTEIRLLENMRTDIHVPSSEQEGVEITFPDPRGAWNNPSAQHDYCLSCFDITLFDVIENRHLVDGVDYELVNDPAVDARRYQVQFLTMDAEKPAVIGITTSLSEHGKDVFSWYLQYDWISMTPYVSARLDYSNWELYYYDLYGNISRVVQPEGVNCNYDAGKYTKEANIYDFMSVHVGPESGSTKKMLEFDLNMETGQKNQLLMNVHPNFIHHYFKPTFVDQNGGLWEDPCLLQPAAQDVEGDEFETSGFEGEGGHYEEGIVENQTGTSESLTSLYGVKPSNPDGWQDVYALEDIDYDNGEVVRYNIPVGDPDPSEYTSRTLREFRYTFNIVIEGKSGGTSTIIKIINCEYIEEKEEFEALFNAQDYEFWSNGSWRLLMDGKPLNLNSTRMMDDLNLQDFDPTKGNYRADLADFESIKVSIANVLRYRRWYTLEAEGDGNLNQVDAKPFEWVSACRYVYGGNLGYEIQSTPNTIQHKALVEAYEHDPYGNLLMKTVPDEGVSKFVYDDYQRLRFSEDENQRNQNRFSYQLYDHAGRVTEAGEYNSAAASASAGQVINFTASAPSGGATSSNIHYYLQNDQPLDPTYCEEVTTYLYDLPTDDLPPSLANFEQHYLAGKLSKSATSSTATWYSYDFYGNVEWLVSYSPAMGYKTVRYVRNSAGDLIEVKINENEGEEDFYFRYTYDADKRLAEVHSSVHPTHDFVLNSKVYYDALGNIVRKELGEKYQGQDYVYTLQGNLKSINNPVPGQDLGGDEHSAGANYNFFEDLFAETVTYYSGDYQRNGTYIQSFAESDFEEQYTGRIKGVTWNSTADLPFVEQEQILAYGYTYDEQGYLVAGTFGQSLNGMLNQSSGNGQPPTFSSLDKYSLHNTTYDKNGNLTSLERQGATSAAMDILSYNYRYNAGSELKSNQIDYVSDAGEHTIYPNELSDQEPSNYAYDAGGRLVVDHERAISITYYDNGLIKEVWSAETETLLQEYFYDDRGNLFKSSHYDQEGVLVREIFRGYDIGAQLLWERSFAVSEDGELEEEGVSKFFVHDQSRVSTALVSNDEVEYLYELKDHIGNVRTVFKNRPVVLGSFSFDLGLEEWTVRPNSTSWFEEGMLFVSSNEDGGIEKVLEVTEGTRYKFAVEVAELPAGGLLAELQDLDNYGKLMEIELSQGYNEFYYRAKNSGDVGLYVFMPSADDEEGGPTQEQEEGEGPEGDEGDGTIFAIDNIHIAADDLEVLKYADYYPYGWELPGRQYISSAIDDERGYQGDHSRKNNNFAWNEFQLRNYDARLGRWLSVDPAGQYHSLYKAMGNNPISIFDPDGAWGYYNEATGDVMWFDDISVAGGFSTVEGDIWSLVTTSLQRFEDQIAEGKKHEWFRHHYSQFEFGEISSGFQDLLFTYGILENDQVYLGLNATPDQQHEYSRKLQRDFYHHNVAGRTPLAGKWITDRDGMRAAFAPQNHALESSYPVFTVLSLGTGLSSIAARGVGNLAKTPVGRSGNVMKVLTKNSPTTIGGRKFTGHALDRMQSRGILSPRAVLDVVKNPARTFPGNTPGTSVFIRDNLKVITNKAGDIITVIPQ